MPVTLRARSKLHSTYWGHLVICNVWYRIWINNQFGIGSSLLVLVFSEISIAIDNKRTGPPGPAGYDWRLTDHCYANINASTMSSGRWWLMSVGSKGPLGTRASRYRDTTTYRHSSTNTWKWKNAPTTSNVELVMIFKGLDLSRVL